MLPELEALLQLQRYDAQLMEIQRKREDIPRRREALKASLDQAKASNEQAKKDLEKVRHDRRAQEKEIEVVQGEWQKLERQLLDVKTNQEYQAMLAQIAALKSKRSDRETVVLEHFEHEEDLVGKAKQAEQRIAEEERKLKAGEAELEKEAASLDQSIHSIKVDRDAVRPKVPTTILARYDRLAGTRDGIAVAEIRKGACGACFKALTPQAVQEARRMEAVQQCEQCGRILIWSEGSAA
ncbi:MAG TPA: C4-type zinc ribbon domain-containing protein [Candidatus Polarisedimenticolia bacterium]|nr:C4-type zinc ribbon domain-containing protein [Candidatus Polarisedimenticolia bacterium]